MRPRTTPCTARSTCAGWATPPTSTASRRQLTREDQDAYSAQSHERAVTARKNGLFDDEIVNVTVPQRRGDPLTVTDDEGVREGTTAASLAKLRPAFSADGTVTAGPPARSPMAPPRWW